MSSTADREKLIDAEYSEAFYQIPLQDDFSNSISDTRHLVVKVRDSDDSPPWSKRDVILIGFLFIVACSICLVTGIFLGPILLQYTAVSTTATSSEMFETNQSALATNVSSQASRTSPQPIASRSSPSLPVTVSYSISSRHLTSSTSATTSRRLTSTPSTVTPTTDQMTSRSTQSPNLSAAKTTAATSIRTNLPTTETSDESTQVNNEIDSTTCGRRVIGWNRRRKRVIHGHAAVYGSCPWQARLLKKTPRSIWGDYSGYYDTDNEEFSHWCGGTIIDRDWILTAGHCVKGVSRADLRIRVGDHDGDVTDTFEQEFVVQKIIIHPLFDAVAMDYDAALIKVAHTSTAQAPHHIRFNNYVQPACLPSKENSDRDYAPGSMTELSGWGLTNVFGSETPEFLQTGRLYIMNDTVCEDELPGGLTDVKFCAGDSDAVDAYNGDSGGPLVREIDGSFSVLGIVSYGVTWATTPTMFTKVAKVSDWIKTTIQNKRLEV